ncbi:uncharacterized protein TRIADDRAFT_55241 [Trichoplax adhaerens]|uniref:Inositol 1,4,5-trisphosphate receptor n=1 Tax=Trichoplax adhaerens TaxID=10228 RepID=B3RUD1_TRIAD|nr:predicted protein [Trichoplax adhaerens]EDV25315.1 predicted protein [Trichoplax adhaerens]|eukprot:XP_002111348.1 predicted protein [Trichoplax adhaerens]
MAKSVCLGDVVSIYSEERQGYAFAVESSVFLSDMLIIFLFVTSSAYAGVCIGSNQDRLNPQLPNSQVAQFVICTQNRYKNNKKYRKAVEASSRNPGDLSARFQVSTLKMSAVYKNTPPSKLADAEAMDNSQEQKRQTGRQLTYGQVVQLKHVFTNKYISASSTHTSQTETSNMLVQLSEYEAKHCQFRVMPRYKVKSEGDIIHEGDQIVLESVKSAGQYLHCSQRRFGSLGAQEDSYEMNLSVRLSGFTIYSNQKPEAKGEEFLKGVSVVRLFHRELEAYVTAEGLFDDRVTETVHLRVRPVDPSRPKSLNPTSSAITYWQIELLDEPMKGSIINWGDQCRLRHMVTRKYLIVQPVEQSYVENAEITYESYCRIEHSLTGQWLHALQGTYYRKSGARPGTAESRTLKGLAYDGGQLKKMTVVGERMYDDAYTIQKVEDEFLADFNYMAGMVASVQKFIRNRGNNVQLRHSSTSKFVSTLKEISDFMIVNGEPCKHRQKLMRNLKIIELIVQILEPSDNDKFIQSIYCECYKLLNTYVMGDSRKNELYIARHIDFFQTRIGLNNKIALTAAEMTTELIRDNRKIIDRIGHKYIDQFIALLTSNKYYQYLDLLNVLCVCNGRAIPNNQTYITETLLKSGKGERNVVYLTELGQRVNLNKDIVYVSTSLGRNWVPLHRFIQSERDPEFLFLDHQLDLFNKLCWGRNEFAIKTITQDLEYLTWQEAFICLRNEDLPDRLRARYCDLITGMFINIPGNHSVLDELQLSFIYSDLVKDRNGKKKIQNVPLSFMSELKQWIASFLDANKDMTASLIGHNMLIEQVLRLVQNLVRFGYYEDLTDMEKLIPPLLSLLDGRNDKPVPFYTSLNSDETEQLLRQYREVDRFKESAETKAVVDAKYQAMEAVDLLFNFRFNKRLELFINEFKHIYETSDDLYFITNENFSLEGNRSLCKKARERLNEIFEAAQYFDTESLRDIFLDLSKYEYNQMVVKSMHLLHRLYSTNYTLFDRAVQAQVLIKDSSCEVFRHAQKAVPVIRRILATNMNNDQATTLGEILDTFTGFCSLENDPTERHSMNQTILYNFGILSDIFDILGQEFDAKLADQYKGVQMIFQKSFSLLQALSRGNKTIQDRVYKRLNSLLRVKGAVSSMALALTEIFTGNKDTCLKIRASEVYAIMKLVAEYKEEAPELIDLLNAIVKVEELDLPIKRNQGLVMKYFMEYRDRIAEIIDNVDKRKALCNDQDKSSKLHQYCYSLINLLATCAEGENRFIESICQTILPIEDIVEVLNHPGVDDDMKNAYCRFFLWVYLNTAGGMYESGAADLNHDDKMWIFISNICSSIGAFNDFAKLNPNKLKDIFKKNIGSMGYEMGKYRSMKNYLLEGVIPLLQAFFKRVYIVESERVDMEQKHIDALGQNLVTFCGLVAEHLTSSSNLNAMINCTTTVLPLTTLPITILSDFQDRFSNQKSVMIENPAVKAYNEYYKEESHLNVILNIFAVNFKRIYQGENTVEAQTGFNSSEQYVEEGSDNELPLGEEFQLFTRCFARESPTGVIFTNAEKLVKLLEISSSMTRLSEKERIRQESLDVKCLMTLRAIIYNQVIKLPPDWEEKPNEWESYGTMIKVLPLLSRRSDDIIRELLSFLAAMLLEGNSMAQASLAQYFLGTREESFFFAIKGRMNMSMVATKEKRVLLAQHKAKMDEKIQQAKSLSKAVTAGKSGGKKLVEGMTHGKRKSNAVAPLARVMKSRSESESPLDQDDNDEIPHVKIMKNGEKQKLISQNSISRFSLPMESEIEMKSVAQESIEEQSENAILNLYKDDGYIELVLRVLASMCDGQNTTLQNYLREQLDNIKSVNLVAETAKYLHMLYDNINSNNISLTTQIFVTLIEYSAGCFENHPVIYDSKIIDCINFILRESSFHGCSEEEIYTLKQAIVKLVACLIEDNCKQSLMIAREIKETIDVNAVLDVATDCYRRQQMAQGKFKDLVVDVGFGYFHILMRLRDLDENKVNLETIIGCDSSVLLDKTKEREKDEKFIRWKAMEYYQYNSLSIEILREGILQKVHFRVLDKGKLREGVKEKVKWNVNRTSPSNKLRDFVDWSKDIRENIRYQSKILSNKIAAFFVKRADIFTLVLNILTLAINILMIVDWRAAEFGVANPKREQVNIFAPAKRQRTSYLEHKFLSFKTFYLLILLVFSILGTCYRGYFFALHLLHTVANNNLFSRIIKSVTLNGRSLIVVGILGVIMIYIYSVIAFASFREWFDSQGGLFCGTLGQCFVTGIRVGFLSGFHEALGPTNQKFEFYAWKLVFDLSFYILVTTIGLNIIFGIIVDTFSELRQEKYQTEHDMETYCFICSKTNYEFEHYGKGFYHHVKHEHNMWDYLYFFIHLDDVRKNDYTYIELYVHELMEKDQLEFFPLNQALTLQDFNTSQEQKLEDLALKVETLIKRQEENDLVKKMENKRRKEQDWEQMHRDIAINNGRQRSNTVTGFNEYAADAEV